MLGEFLRDGDGDGDGDGDCAASCLSPFTSAALLQEVDNTRVRHVFDVADNKLDSIFIVLTANTTTRWLYLEVNWIYGTSDIRCR